MKSIMEIEKMYPFVLVALVAVCYSNSLRCGLVFDDVAAISDNRDIRPHTPISNIFLNDFWGTSLQKEQSHKSYRPLTVLSFRLNYAVHGLEAFGYHLINILLHALVCHLFHKLCLHFMSEISSLVSSALFAAHPVHTEAVTGVVGRAELLSTLAFLGALLFYINHRCQQKSFVWQDCGVTSLLAILGLLCKEQGITVLVICCIYELFSPKISGRLLNNRHILDKSSSPTWRREKVLRIIILLSVFTASLYFRWKLMGKRMPVFNRFDNPAAVSQFPVRQLTYNYLLTVNMGLLLFPHYLCCDWTMSTIPLVSSLWDIRNFTTLFLYVTFVYLLKTISKLEDDSKLTLIMGISIMVIPFLPASNLLFPVGFVVAERILYIPSMGFCMLVAHGWSVLFEKRSCKHFAMIGVLCLIIVGVCKTITRNADWKNEYTLYKSSLNVNQRNGKLFNNMGKVLESLNRPEEALEHYESAKKIEPKDVRSYLNIGRILTSLRRFDEAEATYRKAQRLLPSPSSETQQEVHVTPSHLQLFLNLALLISQNETRLEEADAVYKKALELKTDFTKAYLNRGDVLIKMNRTKEAEAMYHRALEYDKTNPDLYFNLGVVLMDQGRNMEALEEFNKALELEPDHEKSLELSAVLMHGSGIPNHKNLAEIRLEKIIDRGKETERVYINLGLVAIDNKNYPSAEKWFRKALQKDPISREALFNLALLLSEQHRQTEALFSLDQLLKNYPSHTNGLILLADINVNYLKNLDAAEKCYNKVLELDPSNQKAQHNLCVLHFERQDFESAERCFIQTLTLHPDVPYIQQHLEIVRSILRQHQSRTLEHLAAPYSVS
ncbi:hypothetical protein JTE90_006195 [Oedothorax gibbosus]|uniref:dolichyl-phosphate-mannose--protein mannosyltransferase n=1 Tax=Oedothorax gibbosus TaxID=931172 RepID=A0AAV6VUH4_9ARAC|nr:hypothetical protein JTE90_006195 [Oedothorax gibbosus]